MVSKNNNSSEDKLMDFLKDSSLKENLTFNMKLNLIETITNFDIDKC